MDRIADICANLDQASLEQLNSFISFARSIGILQEGDNVEATRDNVARLCQTWIEMKRLGKKRKAPEGPSNEVEDVRDPRLLLQVPSDVRRLFLMWAKDWETAARMCNVNKQLSDWCREHNVWLFLLQNEYNVQIPFNQLSQSKFGDDDFMADLGLEPFYDSDEEKPTPFEAFKSEFFTKHPYFKGIINLSQPDPDKEIAQVHVRMPDWAEENPQAFAAAFALVHKNNTSSDEIQVSYPIDTRPGYHRLRFKMGRNLNLGVFGKLLKRDLLEFVEPKDLIRPRFFSDWWTFLKIDEINQVRAFYNLWKDFGFRWPLPPYPSE